MHSVLWCGKKEADTIFRLEILYMYPQNLFGMDNYDYIAYYDLMGNNEILHAKEVARRL